MNQDGVRLWGRQAEMKSWYCLCTQHGKNIGEKHVKILDRRATKMTQHGKTNLAVEVISSANLSGRKLKR